MRLLEVSRETLPLLYVVEGKSDVATLSQLFDGPILTTNGSAVSDDLIQQLLILEAKYTIVLLLDPDGPGEKIRRVLNGHLSYPVNIFIPKELAQSRNKQKVGVEHVSRETLKRHLLEPKLIQPVEMISTAQLMELGLSGVVGASVRRMFVCARFNLGLANAKTLRHKLQMFGITFDQVLASLEGYDE